MKHYNRNRVAQWGGGAFTDLYILGTTRGAAGVSDFTAGALTQDFTLETPAAGDILTYPTLAAWCKIGFVGTAVTNASLSAGISAGGVEFATSQTVLAVNNGVATKSIDELTVAGAVKVFGGATPLSVRITTVGGNLSVLTAGEVWIYLCILRVNDFITLRYG